MHRSYGLLWAGLVALALSSASNAAEIVFENGHLRAVLREDATWQTLLHKPSNRDYCPPGKGIPAARIGVGKAARLANRATLTGDRLTLGFAGGDTQCVYRVSTTPDWIAFQLEKITGPRPQQLTLLTLRVGIVDHVGPVLAGAWNDQAAFCLRGINLQTHTTAVRRGKHADLSASSQDAPGPKLEGSGAALLAAAPQELPKMLARLATAYDLPRNEAGGVASRDLPIARQSYWFLSFAEKDADRVVDLCQQSGLRQVMLNCGSWCAQVGHYTFNRDRYPDGLESLRRTVARLHAAGILVGMHTFSSKVSKTDAYVTPVPDRRFCVDRTASLAAAVSPNDVAIPTTSDLSQWPGSPVCRQKIWEGNVVKHQEVILDDEIVFYERIGPEGKWNTFEGCRRGAFKTRAASHAAGTEGRHYAVDGCINGYILDLDSTLFDETTSRLAEIFNACGFDMVYFDGSEDVDPRRFHYYAAKAHAVPMQKFSRRPLVHQGGGFGNELWHSFTRGGTVDTYLNTLRGYIQAGGTLARWPTVRDHIDTSVRYAQRVADDMTPAELGWFGIWPKTHDSDGLQYDEIEYLMCKSVALDAAISLQTSFSQMEAHPLTPDLLAIVRAYEELRLQKKVPPTTAARLGQQGKDFLLLPRAICPSDSPEFLEVSRVPNVAQGNDLRARAGRHESDTVASLWHYLGKDGKLRLDCKELSVYDVSGKAVPIERSAGGVVVPIDARRLTLRFPKTTVDEAVRILGSARFDARKLAVLWIPANAYQRSAGQMATGKQAGVKDEGALGEFVVHRGKMDEASRRTSYCEYQVKIPKRGLWTLWARVRYPGGGDLSFAIARADETASLTGSQVLGNCGLNQGQWHWTGRGGGSTSAPPGSPIRFKLEEGDFVFRIHPREGGGRAEVNPRLDCLCLAEDPDYVPSDADARAGLEAVDGRRGTRR